MVIEEVQTLRRQTGRSCRQVLEAADLSRASYQRWSARLRQEQPPVQPPGPKKEVQLNLPLLLEQVQGLEHRQKRSFGAERLYQTHRRAISRRQLQTLVKQERCRRKAERRRSLRRITWHGPGLVWAMDSTRVGGIDLQQVQDLASRYKLDPLVAQPLSGAQVAAHLEGLFALHGPPLILKRDRGSNQRDDAVQAVLENHLVIALDSPRQYPPYNGAIEHAQREIKEALGEGPSLVEVTLANHRSAVQRLNHRPRPCLNGRTACAVFQESRETMKLYTRPKRKEVIDSIKRRAQAILHQQLFPGQREQEEAWRKAVESWLHQNGVITVEVNGEVLPHFP
jgi:transposase InsO family protein